MVTAISIQSFAVRSQTVRTYFKEIVESIAQIHNSGYIHGDIKPQNVIRLDGKMRVIDLDAAAKIDTSNQNEASGDIGDIDSAYFVGFVRNTSSRNDCKARKL